MMALMLQLTEPILTLLVFPGVVVMRIGPPLKPVAGNLALLRLLVVEVNDPFDP